MSLTLEDLEGTRVVRVTATVEFDAYVMAPDPEQPGGYRLGSLDERIRWEIADAVEYRATHLTDSEPGDALVALVEHPDVAALAVDVGPADPADALRAAEGSAGEVF